MIFNRGIGVVAVVLAGMSSPASADCGLNVVCSISESASAGAAEGARPLVTDVMEREAPALIDKLQAAVDHNIMTGEEAGKRLTLFATVLLDKTIHNANISGKELIVF